MPQETGAPPQSLSELSARMSQIRAEKQANLTKGALEGSSRARQRAAEMKAAAAKKTEGVKATAATIGKVLESGLMLLTAEGRKAVGEYVKGRIDAGEQALRDKIKELADTFNEAREKSRESTKKKGQEQVDGVKDRLSDEQKKAERFGKKVKNRINGQIGVIRAELEGTLLDAQAGFLELRARPASFEAEKEQQAIAKAQEALNKLKARERKRRKAANTDKKDAAVRRKNANKMRANAARVNARAKKG